MIEKVTNIKKNFTTIEEHYLIIYKGFESV